jgi:hypothetical protein
MSMWRTTSTPWVPGLGRWLTVRYGEHQRATNDRLNGTQHSSSSSASRLVSSAQPAPARLLPPCDGAQLPQRIQGGG